MEDVRKAAEERAARPKNAPVGAGFESERQREKNALVRQLDAQDGRNVRKIAAATAIPEEDRILRVAAYCRVSTDDIDQKLSIHRPVPPGIQRNPYPSFPQAVNPVGIGGLSREERQEAKRLAEEANFSFNGYQVVRREFISHRFDPAMTIRGNSITFNNSCISKLEDATYIQFLINPTERKLAIRPCDEGARDAVRWCVVKGDKRKSREITCRPFTTKLYELMGWEELYRYKLQGMRITYQGESLYLFDLSAKETYLPQSRDPETGKLKRPKAILPQEWLKTFGMSVDEHTASTQIDLSDGFVSSGMASQEQNTQVPSTPTDYVEVSE